MELCVGLVDGVVRAAGLPEMGTVIRPETGGEDARSEADLAKFRNVESLAGSGNLLDPDSGVPFLLYGR